MPQMKKGKVITVTSMKGGVGKTVLVLQLAALLKKIKKSILIVDLDLYGGDIAFALDLDVKSNVYNLCDDVANNRYKSDYIEEYIVKYDNNIDVLAAPKDPRQAAKIDRKYLEVILKSFVHKYDVVLIDTNHILSISNMVAFECSNVILDIFTNDPFDLKRTKNFVAICKNMGVDNLKLLLNTNVDDRRKTFEQNEVESITKAKIDYIIPKSLYIKNFDKSIIEGKTLEICEKMLRSSSKEFVDFSELVIKLLEDDRKGVNNEKE